MVGIPRRAQRLLLWLSCLLAVFFVAVLAYKLHHQMSMIDRLPKSVKDFQQPPPNQVVLDIRIQSCTWPWCGSITSKTDNGGSALQKRWVLVPKDLRLGQSWRSKTFLSYQVVNRDDSQHDAMDSGVLIDIKVMSPSATDAHPDFQVESSPTAGSTTHQPKDRDGWHYRGHGIWVRLGIKSDSAITALNVLFGEGAIDPRPNWTLLKLASIDFGKYAVPDAHYLPYLSFRRENQSSFTEVKLRSELRVNSQAKLKILQVSDLHFSTGPGKCLDPTTAISGDSDEECSADAVTLEFLNRVLDVERPDFVALTGDAIFGQACPDAETAMYKALSPFILRQIPWALIMGNHDDEGSLDRNELMTLAQSLPYSLTQTGPRDVEGVGNYVVTATLNGSDKNALALFFLDTHKYSPSPRFSRGYDWIRHLQLEFVEHQAAELLETLVDHPLAMAFIHIPLPEYRNFGQPLVGQYREGVTAPNHNTHARTVLRKAGVQVVTSGHDHCNDYCLNDAESQNTEDENHIWLCFGGGAGEGGYGGYGGYIRRMRIFEIDVSKGDITSWKRAQNDPEFIFDTHKLVSGGDVTRE